MCVLGRQRSAFQHLNARSTTILNVTGFQPETFLNRCAPARPAAGVVYGGVVGRETSTHARTLATRLVADRPRVATQAALLRIASGAIFVAFGLGKFTNQAAETRSFAKYGLPSPELFAPVIGVLELVLGLLLVAGLATRFAAAVLAGDMIGAIATAGRVEGGAINLGLAPALLVVMLFLAWSGAGRWSVDARVRDNLATGPPAPP